MNQNKTPRVLYILKFYQLECTVMQQKNVAINEDYKGYFMKKINSSQTAK